MQCIGSLACCATRPVQVNWAYGGSAACPDVSMGSAFSGSSPGGSNMNGPSSGTSPGNFTGGPPGNGTGMGPGGGGGTPLSTTNTTLLYLSETQAQL